MRLHTIAIGALILVSTTMTSRAQDGGEHWNAPDRAAKVAALIPGRAVPKYTPQTLFAEWTAEQAARWAAEHPQQDAEALYAEHAATAPTDAELTDDFPIHISPFGQPRGGGGTQPTHHLTDNAEKLLNTYCPFCGSHSFSLAFDANDPYGHAVTGCCKTHLYSRDEDWPADSPLKPTTTVPFAHLDDTVVDVACTLHTDPEGVEWELFIPIAQQAQVDFVSNPDRANAIIVDAVEQFDSFWVYSPELAAASGMKSAWNFFIARPSLSASYMASLHE